ncbi:MAG: hypothetical protein Q3Y08_02700 [Butyricicoccus sp.]|nr:hypothetical protein [Butyricicoccus sp.]
MKKHILYKVSILTGVLGILLLVLLILSGVAYPHPFFRIGAPLGVFLLFASLLLRFIHWIWDIRDHIQGKQYLGALGILLLGIFVVVQAFLRS